MVLIHLKEDLVKNLWNISKMKEFIKDNQTIKDYRVETQKRFI
jgi:hypothetical protein